MRKTAPKRLEDGASIGRAAADTAQPLAALTFNDDPKFAADLN